MRPFWLFISILVIGFLMIGCNSKPMRTESTNNPEVSVGILFDYDGCRVYRFEDGGSYRYFAHCGLMTTTSWNEQHDKTHIPMSISTAP